MKSVGYSFGVVRGYKAGNLKEAQQHLDSFRPEELAERNRQESRVRNRVRKRAIGVGDRPKSWR